MVAEVFADKLAAGWDIRPTIAVTKAHVNMPEIMDAMAAGRLKPDNDILSGSGDVQGDQGGDRAGVVAARHRRALRRQGSRSSPHALRADRRHVHRAGDAARPRAVPAADRRLDDLFLRRRVEARQARDQDRLPPPRRVQRLRRVRLRHLHLPALSRARHRDLHRDGAAGRRRRGHLQSQGRPRAGRGHQVPGLQRAQAPARRRFRRRSTSTAPNAWRACRTCASRS